MGLKTLFLLLICFGNILFSQNNRTNEDEYIRQFENKITTRIYLINTSNNFYFEDDEGLETEFAPNSRDYLGASIGFRSIEIAYGYSPSFLSENEDNEDSKLFNLNFRMFFGQWMQNLDYYKQKGFTVTIGNQSDYIKGLETLKIGGRTSYVFNKNFSFRAIGAQNEWQTRSAGSFVPRLAYYYTRYKLKEAAVSEDASTINIALSPGYYYNWAITKNVLLSGGLTVGAGVSITEGLGEKDTTSLLYESTARVVLSYNSDTFFGGITANASIFQHDTDQSTILSDELLYAELYIGYRFKAPKKLIEFANTVNAKLGL